MGDHVLAPPWWLAPVEAAALVAWARACGLSWAQLGLGRNRLGSGLRWGLGAIAVVAVVYLIGVLVPLARPAFQDSRYHLPAGQALFTALVVIPFGTVVLEEVAFRSVLWGMLARHCRTWQVLVTTSLLFGLWHVLPSLRLATANRGVAARSGPGEPPWWCSPPWGSRRWAGRCSASCDAAATACSRAWGALGDQRPRRAVRAARLVPRPGELSTRREDRPESPWVTARICHTRSRPPGERQRVPGSVARPPGVARRRPWIGSSSGSSHSYDVPATSAAAG